MENIIDLYKNPLNHGKLKDATITHRAYNPLCGDDITVDLIVEDDKIKDVRHRGVGCAISQAAVSMLTENIKGEGLAGVMGMKKEEVIDMLGIELGPVRLKCALLGLESIHEAIISYRK
ncbi:MAG: iron-sulfur cluster assembly scaffold protein [Candidatus Gracilibacteria bacterium]|nr:iron-sulfur cluster assembly scaffold protein [Candidatus Gracilibacteria bacterium]